MHELPWITIFWLQVRWFANDFHEWRSHSWKSLANYLTSDQISLFMVTNVLFYFLHAVLCPEHTVPLKTIVDRSVCHCRQHGQGRSFSALALWRHHSWPVTSREREILALWNSWRFYRISDALMYYALHHSNYQWRNTPAPLKSQATLATLSVRNEAPKIKWDLPWLKNLVQKNF